MKQIDIKVDGKPLGTLNPAGKQSFIIALGATVVNKSVDVVATDNAGNVTTVSVSAPGDNTIPYIVTTAPTALGFYDTKEVPVTGYVKDGSKVAYLKLKGDGVVGSPIDVNLTYNATTKQYDFATQVTFNADGAQDLYFEGADVLGNKIEFRRSVFIDTEGPTLQVSGLPTNNVVAANGADPVVTANIADNFDDLRLVVNGNEEYRHDFDQPFVRRALSVDQNVTLKLKDGRNDFVFEVTDLTGHQVRKTVSLYKGDNPPAAFVTSLSVTPNGEISAENPATIKAEASESITWDVKVIDPDGNAIALPSAEGKTYEGTFTPGPLAASGQYTVVVAPANGSEAVAQTATISVMNHPITVAAVSTLNADGEKASTFTKADSVSIKANLKNVGHTVVNPTVYVQVKDADGAVVSLQEVAVSAINTYSQNFLGADIALDGFESGTYSIELFVWDNHGNPVPLADASNGGFFSVN
ncbi:hypothetical protein RCG23_13450 [Neobacillus sp. PS3-34]|uniref:hypothetical protein n=1 Tax=Neobacillus sp. PS3-34 TaxID=3070678 RepID=UPI0027DF55B6|nr:hypothetical protein [Neobacillus sp. PS3-34]WML46655.1 hypothetical protein RCG23_13450 [Neobacillus sp. PS3-34]